MSTGSLSTAPSRAGKPDPLAILLPPIVLVRWRVALRQFAQRAIARQYRVTALGFFWTLLVPLATLAIYTFAFGVMQRTQWQDAAGTPFVLILFAGLLVFWLMAQTLSESCNAIVNHTNLVKKAVFPLEIIPVAAVGSALFQMLINTAILLAACAIFGSGVPVTALLFPVVLVPFVLLLIGLAWFLSALGVFFRDLGQVIGLVLTGALFLSPVLYPISGLSSKLQAIVMLNPVSFIAVQTRQVLLQGQMPDWIGLGWYLAIAWLVASLGLAFFNFARKTFADVL